VSLSRCTTCQNVCVQQSHAGLPFSDFKQTQIAHHNKSVLSYNKNRAVDSGSGRQWCPVPHLKYVPPISCLAPWLLHTSNMVFNIFAPFVVFCPPCCKILAMDLSKNPENVCYEQKHMSVLIWFETIIAYWFNCRPPSKFSSATKTSICGRPFLLHKRFFVTLVTYSVDDISH